MHKLDSIAAKDFENEFFRWHKRYPNFKNPKNIADYWGRIYLDGYYDSISFLADKLAVRKYLEDKGYGYLLPELVGEYNRLEDSHFTQVPEKFALKLNTGSHLYYICKDKSKMILSDVMKKCHKWLSMNKFVPYSWETHYNNVKPKLMIEKFIEGIDDDYPIDYKFHCHDGHVDFCMACAQRETGVKFAMYDREWKKLPYVKDKNLPKQDIPKPHNLDELIRIAEELSKGIKLVRVDLYTSNDKIYFGEFTLSPTALTWEFCNDNFIDGYLNDWVEQQVKDLKK